MRWNRYKPDDIEYMIWEQEEGKCWQISINWTRGSIIAVNEYGQIEMKRSGLTTWELKKFKNGLLEIIKR